MLGLDEFDEDVFLDKVDFIEVWKRHELTFHMKDGTQVARECEIIGHSERWTPEVRQAKSDYYRRLREEKRQNGTS